MSEVEFDKKAHVLSVMYVYRGDYDWAQAIFEIYDAALPLAFVYHNGLVTGITEKGMASIEDCWAGIDKTLNLTPFRVEEIIEAGTTNPNDIYAEDDSYVEMELDEDDSLPLNP